MEKGEVDYAKVHLCISWNFYGAINSIVLLKYLPLVVRLHSVQLQITGIL
jgi:hypothetical protein